MTTTFVILSHFFIGIDIQNGRGHVGEMNIGRSESGKREVVVRLDPNRREWVEGKEGGKVPNFAREPKIGALRLNGVKRDLEFLRSLDRPLRRVPRPYRHHFAGARPWARFAFAEKSRH